MVEELPDRGQLTTPGPKRVSFSGVTAIPSNVVPNLEAGDGSQPPDTVVGAADTSSVAQSGPILGVDPGYASEKRAQQRREALRMAAMEDTSVLEDMEAAEEDYDEPEELFNDQGVPIEPFNLRQERQEGYFDADGNYIEYRLDAVQDAWLEGLEAGQVEVDERLAERAAAACGVAAEPLEELDEDDVLIYKRRMLDMLLPGETVLRALRRLGGARQPATTLSTAERQARRKQAAHAEGSGAAADPSTSAAAGESSAATAGTPGGGRPHAKSVTSSSSAIQGENSVAFDKLTEYADLLLSNGDFDIYNTPRERLLKPTEQQDVAQLLGEAAGEARTGAGTLSKPEEGSAADVDMFAADLAAEPTTAAAAPAAAPDGGAAHRAVPQHDELMTDADVAPGSAGDGPNASTSPPGKRTRADTVSGVAEVGDADAVCTSSSGPTASSPPPPADPPTAPPAAAQAAGGSAAAATSIMDGFQLDESTGLYYSSDLGYYYDSASCLFGDAATGLWYQYADGNYLVVS